jgi:para-nitrobenzyl esterase
VVQTASGAVRGAIRNGALEFRGIPYAAPPPGALRWASPQPAAAWEGTLDAAEFRSACPQTARYGLTEASEEEDCLHLNVSAPLPGAGMVAAKRPVIVWIHGGAFVGGAASLYRLDEIVRSGDVVVVSMDYRLGVFGFMPHPAFDAEHNGGYALEDQRLALRWVQRNITAFGGDPENMTSAGCIFPLRRVEESARLGRKVAERVGCGDTATALA